MHANFVCAAQLLQLLQLLQVFLREALCHVHVFPCDDFFLAALFCLLMRIVHIGGSEWDCEKTAELSMNAIILRNEFENTLAKVVSVNETMTSNLAVKAKAELHRRKSNPLRKQNWNWTYDFLYYRCTTFKKLCFSATQRVLENLLVNLFFTWLTRMRVEKIFCYVSRHTHLWLSQSGKIRWSERALERENVLRKNVKVCG